MLTNETPKNPKKFTCLCCDFTSSNKKDYTRHLSTDKHKMLTNTDTKISQNPKSFNCECGKKYKYRQSLSVHKKKCKFIIDEEEPKNTTSTEHNEKDKDALIDKLLATITLQSKQISELIPVVGNNNNNNTINNKQKFNINVFLNETCKDAMSITEFTESLVLKLEDMMYSKDHGTIEGLSNIIIKNLNDIEVEKRPIHCTDLKRETLYIKDADIGWEKEGIDREKMKKMITRTQRFHGNLLNDWKNEHPDWESSEKLTAEFHDLVSRLCYADGGENKIIKNIAKEVQIEK